MSELREAAKAFYNLTAADSRVTIRAFSDESRDIISAAAERLRAALAPTASESPHEASEPDKKTDVERVGQKPEAPFESAVVDHNMRRLTGLWRYGVNVLPPAQISSDFYVWLALLDEAINERTAR